jgi:hypothetical protein
VLAGLQLSGVRGEFAVVLYVTGFIDSLMNVRPLWEGEAFLEKPTTKDSLREAASMLLYGTTTKPTG